MGEDRKAGRRFTFQPPFNKIENVETHKALTVSEVLLSVFLVGVFLKLARSFMIPVVLALFFYFILSPVLDLLTRMKIARPLAVTIIVLVMFLVLYGMGVMFYESGKAFASDLPKYGQKLGAMVDSLQAQFHLAKAKWDPLIYLKNLNIDQIGTVILTSLGTFLSFLSNIFLVLIFLIFMLAGRGKLNEKIIDCCSPHRATQMGRILGHIDKKVQKYLAIKTVICIVSGLLAALILVLFGVDFAVAFGFLTFLLNYIPNIGAFIAKIIPFLIAVIQFSSFWRAAWILIVLLAVDAIIGMIVEPKLMGKGMGLSPLVILFSLFFWGWLWGIPGMILAVPIMAILKIVVGSFPELRWLDGLLGK
jgi:AI-2 transport protein TqsA